MRKARFIIGIFAVLLVTTSCTKVSSYRLKQANAKGEHYSAFRNGIEDPLSFLNGTWEINWTSSSTLLDPFGDSAMPGARITLDLENGSGIITKEYSVGVHGFDLVQSDAFEFGILEGDNESYFNYYDSNPGSQSWMIQFHQNSLALINHPDQADEVVYWLSRKD